MITLSNPWKITLDQSMALYTVILEQWLCIRRLIAVWTLYPCLSIVCQAKTLSSLCRCASWAVFIGCNYTVVLFSHLQFILSQLTGTQISAFDGYRYNLTISAITIKFTSGFVLLHSFRANYVVVWVIYGMCWSWSTLIVYAVRSFSI